MTSVGTSEISLLILLFIFTSYSTGSPKKTNTTSLAHSHKYLDFIYATAVNGYLSEEHSVVTEDGYILRMFRIVETKNCHTRKIVTPVLLMHGLLESSDAWIAADSNTALAYLIADACFDVWLGNVRGNYYSRRHVTLNPDTDASFWKFSVDEIGRYDVPAMIDYVLNSAGVQKLNYIGFSQGCGIFFIMCSERPEYSKKVNVMIALAPATRHLNARSLVFRYGNYYFAAFGKVMELLGIREVVQKGSPVQKFFAKFCKLRTSEVICEFALSTIDLNHPGSISNDTLSQIYRYNPAGTSVQNLARYGQSMNSDDFVKFDYGIWENLKVYGQLKPPKYNLNAVSMPVVIIYGKNDGIADVKDIKWLIGKLPNVIENVEVKNPLWNHVDMHYGRFFKKLVFQKIYEYLLVYST